MSPAPPAVPPPRRARTLIPASVPRRRQLIAASALVAVLVHLLLAPLALALTLVFAVTSRISRWRLSWLLVPAAAGLAWMLATGLAPALAGFAAGPASVLRHLAGTTDRTRPPGGLLAGIGDWLPRQLPAALPLAAAEAALLGWLSWLHTDEWAVPPPRPGLVAWLWSAVTGRAIRAGAVLTRDGCALGTDPVTGHAAALAWSELSHGVLVAGTAGPDVLLTGLQVVHAALRRRKPVIVLGAEPGETAGRALAAACQATGVPLLPGAPALDAVDLHQVVAERTAVLLPADGDGTAAMARLSGLAADLRRIAVDGDALVWLPRAESVPEAALARLLRDAAPAGLSVLAGTTSPAAAAALASQSGTVVIRRVTDPGLADALAARTGTRLLPPRLAGLPDASALDADLVRCPAVPASDLLTLGPTEFVLAVTTPVPRLVEYARLVPARLPGPAT